MQQFQHLRISALNPDLGLGHTGLRHAARLVIGQGVRADLDKKRDATSRVFAAHHGQHLVKARVRVEGRVEQPDLARASSAQHADARRHRVGCQAGGRRAPEVVAAECAAHRTAAMRLQIGHPVAVRPVDRVVRRWQQVAQCLDRTAARADPPCAVQSAPRHALRVRRTPGAKETQHVRKDRLALADHPGVGREPGVACRAPRLTRPRQQGMIRGDIRSADHDLDRGQAAFQHLQQVQGTLDVPQGAGRG